MIFALHQKRLLPALIMLFALATVSLSVAGEALSHGVAGLGSDSWPELNDHYDGHHGHGHSHDFDEEPDAALHHDAGNHTHETLDQLAVPLITQSYTALRQPVPFAGDSPRGLSFRLERPPKARLPS
ncbi:hypothetical protein [Marinobacter salicampi]|uniref:hypothetical protein n=1 Tax=Marinobacter salicampi TaxID=435907 RepID=UPI00140B4BBC|nr:hypothetical protein [Marinobacter salicampi]